MRKHLYINRYIILIFCLLYLFVPLPAAAEDADHPDPGYTYVHDPMDNPEAAEDIMPDPDAIYGYSPRPDSVRLKEYINAVDWTDPDEVEALRQKRIQYHASMSEIYVLAGRMSEEGKSIEEIARAASALRNEIRLASYRDSNLLETVKLSNLETYGNENGPTPEFLYEKYGDWMTVLKKSISANPGMDACLGLYDEMYSTYTFHLPEDERTPAVNTGVGPVPEVCTVEAGDSLWLIAVKYYDSGAYWKAIYDRNTDQIPQPSLIYPGMKLRMPAYPN